MNIDMKEDEGKLDSAGYAEELNKALYAKNVYKKSLSETAKDGEIETNGVVDYSVGSGNTRDYQVKNIWGTIVDLFTFRFFTDNPAYILTIAFSGFMMMVFVILILADWRTNESFIVLRLIVSTVLGVFGIVLFLNFLVCLVRIKNGRME